MPQLASCGIVPFKSARCHTASGVAAPFAVLRGGLGVKFLGKIFTPYGRKDFTKNFLPGLACLRFASYAQTWLRLSSPHVATPLAVWQLPSLCSGADSNRRHLVLQTSALTN